MTAPRRRLAALDGRRIELDACCRIEVTLSPLGLRVEHDDDCPALDPTTPAGLAARLAADGALAVALHRLGMPTLVVAVEEDPDD